MNSITVSFIFQHNNNNNKTHAYMLPNKMYVSQFVSQLERDCYMT